MIHVHVEAEKSIRIVVENNELRCEQEFNLLAPFPFKWRV